jgi:hypothetical protein
MSGVLVAAGRGGEQEATIVGGSGRMVLALVGRRLFVHALDDATLKQFPPPFTFEPLAGVPAIDPAKPTFIRTSTIGGAAPIEFELLGSAKHVEIDTKSGAVTVSGPALAKLAIERLGSDLDEAMPGLRRLMTPGTRGARYPRGLPRLPQAGQLTPKQAVAQLARALAGRLKAFTGTEPKGIPVLVPVRVAATDKHQQVASMQFQAVLDLPKERLLTAIEAAVAKANQARAAAERAAAERDRQRQAERERRRQEMERARRQAASQPADSEAIRKLEKRIERLEVQVQLLMKLVTERRTGRDK